MRTLCLLVTLAALICAALAASAPSTTEEQYEHAFRVWMKQQEKVYASDEEAEERFTAFKWNYDFVKNWDASKKGFTVALNKFADLTNEEFRAFYNGFRFHGSRLSVHPIELDVTGLPASVNWTAAGKVTPIKNQQQCGSCWSFSTTGTIESAISIASGAKPVGLSEQNLVDCSWKEGNMGCDGGYPIWAMDYVIKNKGIDTEKSYPYDAKSSHDCKYKSADSGGYITGYVNISSGSESSLQAGVAVTPVSVAIDASLPSFQLYNSGIYYESKCLSGANDLDHAVLATGYGATSATKDNEYWIVKNSWGPDWGLSGYIWMARNRNNNCGIATAAAYPTGAKSAAVRN